MSVLTLDFTQPVEVSPNRKLDRLIAEKVMDWTLWNDDWYSRVDCGYKFQHVKLFYPTANPIASQRVWLKCLEKAREMGYELSMKMDDQGRVHINADHPVAKRLLAIDPNINYAISKFATILFDLEVE